MVDNELDVLVRRYPLLKECRSSILETYQILANSFRAGGKLLIAGNGGSASDAEHIAGELMKGFRSERKLDTESLNRLKLVDNEMGSFLGEKLQGALPTLVIGNHFALSTAYMNDCEPVLSFAQQVYGHGQPGDTLLCISTSGKSENILYSAVVARALDMKVIGLTGMPESKLTSMCDVCIRVPETETYMVQELHMPVYHCLAMMLEETFFATS